MLRATGGKSSKDWTNEDMDKLEADLLPKAQPKKHDTQDTQDVQIEANFDTHDNVA